MKSTTSAQEKTAQKLGQKVFITGVAGFIGGHFSERLLKMGLEVSGIDNLSNGLEDNISAAMGSSKFKLLRGDIMNPRDLSNCCRGANTIVHLAAQPSVAKSVENPLWDFEQNVTATLKVLEEARKNDSAFIFASSSTVYGDAPLPTPEDHPLKPISNYGAAKAAGEIYSSTYSHLYGIDTVSLRFYNIYGPRARKGVMFDLLRKLQNNNLKLEVLGTGAQEKDYIHIDDALDALLIAVGKGKMKGESYNVGSGESYNVKQLVKIILDKLGLEGNTKVFYKGGLSWPGDVQKTRADISRIMKLGFSPNVGIEEGLHKFMKWYEGEYGEILS
ncbi:MAG: NAD-dependent epimerase/dehydratase family protein [Candidatus Hadarchaeota archaeon]